MNLCRENDPSIFYIKISTGCLSGCTYCGVRKSRGAVKSKIIEDVLHEFQEGLQKGFKHFSLLGTDLGAYGKDLHHTLTDLLEEILKLEGHYKIGLRNVNPYHLKGMLNELLPIKSKRIWYMECAAESGSNRILELMKRNYSVEEYKDCIQAIGRVHPDIILRTQLMVGFPTETEQDFAETLHLLDHVALDYVEVYEYSECPGTLAITMRPKVPEQIKKQRFRKLFMKSLLNTTEMRVKNLFRWSRG